VADTTDGMVGLGTTIGHKIPPAETYTVIAEVTNIGGPDISVDDVDMSSLDSAEAFRLFLAGMADAGEVALQLVFTDAEFNTLLGIIRESGSFQITFPSTSTLTFDGYLKGLGQETPFDEKIAATATFKVSGKPVFAAA